jgi:hypothetical protein
MIIDIRAFSPRNFQNPDRDLAGEYRDNLNKKETFFAQDVQYPKPGNNY